MIANSLPDETHVPARLNRDKKFQPCLVEPGDEHYANGIFEFNISRLLAFIDTCPERFPVESVLIDDLPNYGSSNLTEETILNADLSRPILLAEIAPGLFNVIDGNHRLARARSESMQMVPARRVRCPDHVAFLISEWAYEKYVNYWNSKLEDLSPAKVPRKHRRASLRTNCAYRHIGYRVFRTHR
jgi:hypothetical protein